MNCRKLSNTAPSFLISVITIFSLFVLLLTSGQRCSEEDTS